MLLSPPPVRVGRVGSHGGEADAVEQVVAAHPVGSGGQAGPRERGQRAASGRVQPSEHAPDAAHGRFRGGEIGLRLVQRDSRSIGSDSRSSAAHAPRNLVSAEVRILIGVSFVRPGCWPGIRWLVGDDGQRRRQAVS
jgi:hypothetical protein